MANEDEFIQCMCCEVQWSSNMGNKESRKDVLPVKKAMVRLMNGVKLTNTKKPSELMLMRELSENIMKLVGQTKLR